LNVLGWPAFENKTGNPYTRLLYEAMEAETSVQVDDITLRHALTGAYDVWHVHWPDDFLSYPSLSKAVTYVAAELFLFAWARVRGARLVWTVHDLGPHESRHPKLERLFWRLFLPMVDGIVTLSEVAAQKTLQRFPALRSVPRAVVPHGHYRPAYPDPVPRSEARRTLDVPDEARLAAFIGRVRPYKNVSRLIETFRAWDDDTARLTIAGNPVSETLKDEILKAVAGEGRIRTDLRFIENDEMMIVLGAADLVVLPYDHILQSGTALLALSFDRPVLVPDRGAMSELQAEVGAEWVRTYEGDLTADTLAHAMDWAETAIRSERAPLDDREWPRLARQTEQLYRRVLDAHD
jgi:glycosyltransferase involved in cell wall biosynthesis